MNSKQGSKYSHINPVYQIDFQSAASGKRLSGTKRRIRFRFGFSNAEAIAQGLTGTDCRGEEHEVVLVWSLASGKRHVLADDQEVHFSKGNRTEGRFETSWTIPGGHMIKLIAHAAPPLFHTPGFRQFDLLLDGRSYFDMPRIFELGKNVDRKQAREIVKRMPAETTHNNCITPTNPTRRDIYSAQEASSYSARSFQEQQPREHFAEAPRASSEPVMSFLEPQTTANDIFEPAPTTVTPVKDEFAPVAAPVEQPTYAAAANQILSAYTSPPAQPTPQPTVPVLANEPHTHYAPAPATATPQAYYQPETQAYMQHQPAPVSPDSSYSQMSISSTSSPALPVIEEEPVAAPKLTMEPLNVHELEVRGNPPKSELERAMQTLVNFSDISEPVESPEQFKLKQKKLQDQPDKSRGLPPAKANWQLGANPSLSEIRQHAEQKEEPKKEIMRTHAFDPAAAQAGMMVVYGASAQGYGMQQQQQYAQQYYYQQPQQQAMMYQQPVASGVY